MWISSNIRINNKVLYLLIINIIPVYLCSEYTASRDSSVGVPTGYGLDDWDLIPGRGNRLFPPHSFQYVSGPDPAPHPMDTRGYSPGSEVSKANVKLTAKIPLVARSILVELYLHTPVSLHSMVVSNLMN
jgi:hypothetical protein